MITKNDILVFCCQKTSMDEVEFLHKRLKKLYKQRKKSVKHLTMNKVAFILKISRQHVVYLFNGSRRIPEYLIDPLCEVLKVTREEFLKNTIQVTGKKKSVNFSNISYDSVAELKEYPGLTAEEVATVLKHKNQAT